MKKINFLAVVIMFFTLNVVDVLAENIKIDNKLFSEGIMLSRVSDHHKHILNLTKNKWKITSHSAHQAIVPRKDGGIFQTFDNFQYILEKGKSTAICYVSANVASASNEKVYYWMRCKK